LVKVCPKHVELILEINKTVIVASRWFLYYLNYKLEKCKKKYKKDSWKEIGNRSTECT